MRIDRRGVLVALGVAGVAAGPGCSAMEASGPRNPPTGDDGGAAAAVRVDRFDFEEADDGSLRVVGAVRNDTGAAVTARVTATVTVAGESTSRSTDVRVEAGSTAEFAVGFDVRFQRFARNGEVDVDVRRA